MSKDSKRLFALILFAMLWVFAVQVVGDRMGWFAKPKPVAPIAEAEEEPAPDAKPEAPKADAEKKPDVAAEKKPEVVPEKKPDVAVPKIPGAKPEEQVLGGLAADSGYRLRVQLTQTGAGVESIDLSSHEAERIQKRQARQPLRIVNSAPGIDPSFAFESITIRDPEAKDDEEGTTYSLGQYQWELVRDEKGRSVRPMIDAKGVDEVGQEIVYRASMGNPAVIATKTFRLRKGVDGIELGIAFDSPTANRQVSYRLEGPRGLPIEGEWYTSMFREAFFGVTKGTATDIQARLASDVVAKRAKPEVFETVPTKFAGVETQYFAVFFGPNPPPDSEKSRIDDQTIATVVDENVKEKQKSDISVEMKSREFKVGPNKPVGQEFKVFAGPKIADVLTPYAAVELASYRKSGWFFIPFAPQVAQNVISPLLNRIYDFTNYVSHAFGGKRGSYGIAIILLTITVRLLLFPLSRKQAMSAKKMQDLSPKLQELKEKYKDDKERFTKEQFALFRANKVNPMGGCLLALIQLPIFVGLWQALNNSVALRHAPFLWIDNLAAPDMLFKFPFEIPLVGGFLGPYFNLLPFAVVALMILQMKLFTPPATTPDQEMSQKMMKYMMVFMSFMFYKVPSGLGIYFITSSTWAICERLLLPKMIKVKPVMPDDEDLGGPGNGNGAKLKPNGGNGNGNQPKPGGFRDRIRQLVEEAQKDRTIRNNEAEKENDRDWGRGGKPRPKSPGRKR